MTPPSVTQQPSVLFINTDGGSRGNPGAAAIGIHAEMNGKVLFEKSATIGIGTNNTAEYTAVVQAFNWLKSWTEENGSSLPDLQVQFRLDSQLVVEQLNGRYKIKQPHILNYVRQIRLGMQQFHFPIHFSYVPRAQNSRADELVNEALDAQAAGISSD
jgi:ribonuclease HI